MADRSVRVKGLRELQRAFKVADKVLEVELKEALKDAAEPIRADAEQLARSSIVHIGDKWSRMRTGVTPKLVYVAPRKRGTRDQARKRPNLALLLAGRSLEPALERNRDEAENRVGKALDVVGNAWERA